MLLNKFSFIFLSWIFPSKVRHWHWHFWQSLKKLLLTFVEKELELLVLSDLLDHLFLNPLGNEFVFPMSVSSLASVTLKLSIELHRLEPKWVISIGLKMKLRGEQRVGDVYICIITTFIGFYSFHTIIIWLSFIKYVNIVFKEFQQNDL